MNKIEAIAHITTYANGSKSVSWNDKRLYAASGNLLFDEEALQATAEAVLQAVVDRLNYKLEHNAVDAIEDIADSIPSIIDQLKGQ